MLKRKASASSSINIETGSVAAKKSRLLTGSHSFYEPLLFENPSRKPQCMPPCLSEVTITTASPGKIRLISSIDGTIVADEEDEDEHSDVKPEFLMDDYLNDDPRTIYESLSLDAREFLENYVKSQSDKKDSSDKFTLTEEEIGHHYYDLINKWILS